MTLIVKVMATLFVAVAMLFFALLLSPLLQTQTNTVSPLEPLRLSLSYEQKQRVFPEIQPLDTMDFAW